MRKRVVNRLTSIKIASYSRLHDFPYFNSATGMSIPSGMVQTSLQSFLTGLHLLAILIFVIDFVYISRRPGLAAPFRFEPVSLLSNLSTNMLKAALAVLTFQWIKDVYITANNHALPIPFWKTHPWFTAIASFLFVDFLVFLWHWLCHSTRIGWAAHQIHHQSTHFNTSVSMRTGQVEGVASSLLIAAPVFFGVTLDIYMILAATRGWLMFWLHTSLPKCPKIIEYFFNTPSHHRKHHEFGPMSGRCNYGSVLIIWDRIFGTFAEEKSLVTNFGVKDVAEDVRPFGHLLRGFFLTRKDFSRSSNIGLTAPTVANSLLLVTCASLVVPMFFGPYTKETAVLCVLVLAIAEFQNSLPSRLRVGVLLLFGGALVWGCVATVWSFDTLKSSARWGGPGLQLLSIVFMFHLLKSKAKLHPFVAESEQLKKTQDLAS